MRLAGDFDLQPKECISRGTVAGEAGMKSDLFWWEWRDRRPFRVTVALPAQKVPVENAGHINHLSFTGGRELLCCRLRFAFVVSLAVCRFGEVQVHVIINWLRKLFPPGELESCILRVILPTTSITPCPPCPRLPKQ